MKILKNSRNQDLVNYTSHNLIVTKKLDIRDCGKYTRRQYWECKCKCGNVIELHTSSIVGTSNPAQSCGCLRRTGYKNLLGTKWGEIKYSAKRRDIVFTITIKYVWNLFVKQNEKCAISGQNITLPSYTTKLGCESHTASLDRIDSNKGYIKGNVQWVHKNINIAKNKLSQKEFIEMCKQVAEYNNDK